MEENCGVPYELELRIRVGEFEKISRFYRVTSEEKKFDEDLQFQTNNAREMFIACYRAILARQHAKSFIK